MKLLLADLMVDMFVQFSHEDRARRVQEARKGSVEKVSLLTGRTDGQADGWRDNQTQTIIVIRIYKNIAVNSMSEKR